MPKRIASIAKACHKGGMKISRREFGRTVALAGAAAAAGFGANGQSSGTRRIKLGLDNFAVRGMGWKAPRLIEYAASLKTDSLFISDLDAFENHSEAYLKDIRAQAAERGLQIHLGTWSICPTSKA